MEHPEKIKPSAFLRGAIPHRPLAIRIALLWPPLSLAGFEGIPRPELKPFPGKGAVPDAGNASASKTHAPCNLELKRSSADSLLAALPLSLRQQELGLTWEHCCLALPRQAGQPCL